MIGGFKRHVLHGFCNWPVIDELLYEQCWRRALVRDGRMPFSNYRIEWAVSWSLANPSLQPAITLRSVDESGVRRGIHRSRMADFSHFKSSFVQKSRSSLCRIEQLVQVSRVDDCLQPVKRAFDGQFQRDFLWVAHWFVVVDSWRILVTTESAMTAASMQKQKATVDCLQG